MKFNWREVHSGNVAANLRSTAYKKPAIAVDKRESGGLHWVVVAGKVGNSGNLLVLDAASGLFDIDPNTAEPQYRDKNGTPGKFTGRMLLVT
jgi:hypothetical protein